MSQFEAHSEDSRHCFYATISLIHPNAEIICIFKGSCFFSVYVILKSKVISIYTELHLVFGFQHYQQKHLPLALMLISSSTDEGFVTPDPIQFLCKTWKTAEDRRTHHVISEQQTAYMQGGCVCGGNKGKRKVANEAQVATLRVQ